MYAVGDNGTYFYTGEPIIQSATLPIPVALLNPIFDSLVELKIIFPLEK
jgi:hypothetical protein